MNFLQLQRCLATSRFTSTLIKHGSNYNRVILLPCQRKKQVLAVEVKVVDEGESSAPPVPNAEKWSQGQMYDRSGCRN